MVRRPFSTRGVPVAFATIVGLAISGCAESETPVPDAAPVEAVADTLGAPVLADLSRLDPAAAEKIRAKHQRALDAPDDATARGELAMTYHANAFQEPAIETYRQTITLDAANAKWWYLMAQAQRHVGNQNDAMASMERSLTLDESYTAAHARLGFWLLEQGRLDDAGQRFDHALRIDADYANGHVGQGRVHMQRGEAQATADILEPLRVRFPDDPYLKYLLGTAYRGLGRLDDARALLEAGAGSRLNWRGMDPWTGDMQRLETGYRTEYDRAQEYITAGQPRVAIEILKQMLQKHPGDIPVLASLGGVHSSMGQHEQAVEIFLSALAIDSNHYVIHLNLGTVYLNTNRMGEALKHTDEAIRLNPTLGAAHFQKGQILTRAGRFIDAETSLGKALEYDAQNEQAFLLLALAQVQQRQPERGVETLQQMTQQIPNASEGFVMLAWLLRDLKRLDEARAIVTTAAERFPGNPRVKQVQDALNSPPG